MSSLVTGHRCADAGVLLAGVAVRPPAGVGVDLCRSTDEGQFPAECGREGSEESKHERRDPRLIDANTPKPGFQPRHRRGRKTKHSRMFVSVTAPGNNQLEETNRVT
ncbi:hypothetical protein F2P81_020692 [Scophthalmus maximus]|uniref:Uncharacterized protein n=1 Tax=Scophthalmus maximus TaxID=52904 RepID=A0A6A4SA22_SCOMX|nr:hypothetical protein F2P81_020692 [Scophthalmus maximus]